MRMDTLAGCRIADSSRPTVKREDGDKGTSVGREILNTTSPLTAREVYQVLKDVALGTRTMTRTSSQLSEIYNGLMPVEIDGWHLTLFNDGGTLDYCGDCRTPDGRVGTVEDWQRYGTDPVELLSGWERKQLERLLNEL